MTNEELFKRLSSGDFSVRDEIIIRNRPLIGHVVKRLVSYESPTTWYEDYFSIGMIGLIKAVDAFNVENGAKFSSFAYMCIANELKTWMRHISKDACTSSLDASMDGDDNNSFMDVLSDDTIVEDEIERRDMLRSAIREIDNLQGNKRKIMTIVVTENGRVTQKEIAKRMRASQPNMSRQIRKAQKILREACGYEN